MDHFEFCEILEVSSVDFAKENGLDESECQRLYDIGYHVNIYYGTDDIDGITHLWRIVYGIDRFSVIKPFKIDISKMREDKISNII